AAAARGNAELCEHKSAGSDLADFVGAVLREPEIAVRAGRDGERPAAGRGNGELIGSGDGPGGGDPAVLAGGVLREPKIAVRAGRVAGRSAVRRGYGKLGEDAAGHLEPADLVCGILREPEIAIGPQRDAQRRAVCRETTEFADANGRHIMHYAKLIAITFGKRKGAVRA